MRRNDLLRGISGILGLFALAAPGSAATGVASFVHIVGNPEQPLVRGRDITRSFHVAGSASSITVTGPQTCSTNGPYSFLGPFDPTYPNYAGGSPGNASYGNASGSAGVVSGAFNEACDFATFIGSGEVNTIGGIVGNLQFGHDSAIVSGGLNRVAAEDSFVGSGSGNLIGSIPNQGVIDSAIISGQDNTIGAWTSFIGAGAFNSIVAVAGNGSYGVGSFIGAGLNNAITDSNTGPAGGDSFIGAGTNNAINSLFSSIVAGQSNVVAADDATIGGGYQNSVGATYGVIAGGNANTVSGIQATVSGGYGNTASGRNAVIPGGAYNVANGLDSLAAGNAAHAVNDGTFVWSDYSATTGLASTAANQFLARAAGGFYLYSSANLKSGVRLAPGSGSWSTLSDRNVKTGIQNVDETRILAKLTQLPVSEWSYTAQGNGVRHLGPMAQDFRAAFGLGEDDRHISTVDEEGVALAAIKALQRQVAEKDAQIAKLRRDQSDTDRRLEAKYARMEQRLDALEAHAQSASPDAGQQVLNLQRKSI